MSDRTDYQADFDKALAQSEECWTCRGQGWVAGISADPLPSGEPGEPYQVQETCPDCGGSGAANPPEPALPDEALRTALVALHDRAKTRLLDFHSETYCTEETCLVIRALNYAALSATTETTDG